MDQAEYDRSRETIMKVEDTFIRSQLFYELFDLSEEPEDLRQALLLLTFEEVPEEKILQENQVLKISSGAKGMVENFSKQLSAKGAEQGFFREVDELPFVHGALVEAYRFVRHRDQGEEAEALAVMQKAVSHAKSGKNEIAELVDIAAITGVEEWFDEALGRLTSILSERYGYEEPRIDVTESGMRLFHYDRIHDMNADTNLALGIRKLTKLAFERSDYTKLLKLAYHIQCVMNNGQRHEFDTAHVQGKLDAVTGATPEEENKELTSDMFILMHKEGSMQPIWRSKKTEAGS